MARTINAIYDEIITEKETFSSLDGLTTPVVPEDAQTMLTELTSASKVAMGRLKFWVVAFAIWAHEKLFDSFVADVEKRALEIIPGTTRFYIIETLKFQNGDDLVFNTITSRYEYADSTSSTALAKQIIKQASAIDVNKIVTIKVAQDDGSGGLEKLKVPAKAAFDSYIDDIQIAGVKVDKISDDPDLVKIAYTIEFDPQVMKNDGSLIEDGSFSVQKAIDGYIQGLPFNSMFRVQELTDAIQVARGVINAIADVIEAKSGVLNFTDILSIQTEVYLPVAGYLATIDELGAAADINVLAITESIVDYDSSLIYGLGVFVLFNRIAYISNIAIGIPEAFDSAKWDTVSNLTFISA